MAIKKKRNQVRVKFSVDSKSALADIAKIKAALLDLNKLSVNIKLKCSSGSEEP